MFASTEDLEFVQGQSRDVPDHELVLNIYIYGPWWHSGYEGCYLIRSVGLTASSGNDWGLSQYHPNLRPTA